MVHSVKFESKEDLFRFSELASQEDFPIYISTTYGQLDAKSILALFTILGKDVNIVAPDHGDVDKFFEFLEKYKHKIFTDKFPWKSFCISSVFKHNKEFFKAMKNI